MDEATTIENAQGNTSEKQTSNKIVSSQFLGERKTSDVVEAVLF